LTRPRCFASPTWAWWSDGLRAGDFPGWVPVNVRAVEGSTCSACRTVALLFALMGVTVVSLGAWAELARREQSGMDIDVHEFAVLDDDRRLTLHQERGFRRSGRSPAPVA
jgi:hypothetical protein